MAAADPFRSMDDYLAVPRVTSLVLSPDGTRLVATVQALGPDGKRYVTSLWQIDPAGGPPRQLTRSGEGESAPAFGPEGDVLFVSKRPDPAAPPGGDETKVAALWRLPVGGGEPEVVARRPGGVASVVVAKDSGRIVALAACLHGDAATDAGRRQRRQELGVSAILHESSPVRHWDRDLGPDHARLFVLGGAGGAGARSGGDGAGASGGGAGAGGAEWRDLTPHAGGALLEATVSITNDGSTLFTDWRISRPGGREGWRVAAIDVDTGEARILEAEGRELSSPVAAPDGSWVVFVDERKVTPTLGPTTTLTIMDWPGGERRDLLPGFDLWPASPVATPDSEAVLFCADERGHRPVFRVEIATGEVTRLSAHGAYSDLCPSPDGASVYALRSAVDSPARPVRLDAHGANQEPVYLDAPGGVGPLPGRLDEVRAVAADGTTVRAWLAHPETPDPAPLLLWVHGGPLSSWNSWSWRWNPWLMVARGWAVLLPDPGLSTGYGDAMVQRAWGQWGPVPFGDLMASVDAAAERSDIDAERMAAMGGSYGGYMANWIAGHTERFKAIVTHASLWSLNQFIGTTDHPGAWVEEWDYPDSAPERYELNSPDRHWDRIRTPMLVIHGDKDYRVPLGEGLLLWTYLVRAGVPAKFLYFPDEGHWVLKPGNVRLWYETVHAFLDHHALGRDWERPELL